MAMMEKDLGSEVIHLSSGEDVYLARARDLAKNADGSRSLSSLEADDRVSRPKDSQIQTENWAFCHGRKARLPASPLSQQAGLMYYPAFTRMEVRAAALHSSLADKRCARRGFPPCRPIFDRHRPPREFVSANSAYSA